MHEGEEFVVEPFQRLIAEERLVLDQLRRFLGCMDTFKEKQQLDDLHRRGETPWELWKQPTHPARRRHREPPQRASRSRFDKIKTILCLGAHSDDIEIGCGGTLLALLAERPTIDVHWVVFGAAERGPRGGRPAPRSSWPVSAPASAGPRLPRQLSSPISAPRSKSSSNRSGQRLARPDLHAPPRGHAPGPPHDRRAHLVRLSRPSDPRVRDPQVRRRPRPPERLRPPRRVDLPPQDGALDGGLSHAAREAVVQRRDVPGHAASAGHRMPIAHWRTPKPSTPAS